MKIVYISTDYIPSPKANRIQTIKMCEAFTTKGVNLSLFIPTLNNRTVHFKEISGLYGVSTEFQINKYKLSINRIGRYFDIFKLLFRIKTEKPDYIFTINLIAGFMAALIFRFPVILEKHEPPLTRLSNFMLKKILNSKKLVLFIMISYGLKNVISQNHNFTNFIILPNGVNINLYQKTNMGMLINSPVVRIGYAGQFFDGRGIDIIICLAKEFPSYEFELIGGNEESVKFWRKKMHLASLKNISFSEFISNDKLPARLSTFHILLLPYQKKIAVSEKGGDSVNYMSSMKLFNYMAAARPIIASNLPIINEILKSGFNAILVKAEDCDAWAEAIRNILKNKQFALQISKNALTDVKEKYTWEKRVERILDKVMGDNNDHYINLS